ncbi:MAG TPA: site-2 protease family protein [Chthoniobacterales bacterium]|nr:site-2 protease family protein [Chthoniobacterales bacterium]
MDTQPQVTEVAGPHRENFWTRTKKALGPLAAAGVIIAKFFAKLKFFILPALKFLPVILKSGGTMLLSIGIYASIWGWKFALGFVLLLFVHECGHLIVAKKFGLKVSAPVFIPFMGAFILLKDQPRNAWMEACVGIGGPMLGSLGALLCHSLGETAHAPILIALAYSGYFLNVFNLTPVGFLDGGRIVTALSRWLWLPGLAVLLWFGWKYMNLIIWLMVFLSLPRVISLFRRRTEAERQYYEVTSGQRWTMSILYFGLIAALVVGMQLAERDLQNRGIRPQQKPRYAVAVIKLNTLNQRTIPTPKTFSGSSPILFKIERNRLSERSGANSGAMPTKCSEEDRSSQARSSSRIASSSAWSATCTCAIASPGV